MLVTAVKGTVKLILYSPADAFNLYPHITPDRVEADGTIIYGVSKILAHDTARYSQVRREQSGITSWIARLALDLFI